MNLNSLNTSRDMIQVVQEIKQILASARSNVARQVNGELLKTYWSIGKIICDHEQSSPNRVDYGK